MSLVYSAGGAMPLPRLAWAFDGTTTDYVSGLVGTTTGTVSYNSGGKYGQSLVITNTPGLVASNYVSYNTPYYPSTLTTAIWIKLNTIGVASQYFLQFGGTSGGISYVISIDSDNAVAFRVQAQSGATTLSTVMTVNAGQWYHIAAVIDGYNQTIYLNGVLAAGPNPCDTLEFQYRNLTLGGSTTNAGRVLVNGELDDLRIFDRALTSAQVQAVYAAQGMPGRGVQTNTRGILDVMNTPTAAAFSLRQLTSTYTGPVVQIRRQSDLISNNFVADFSGNLSNVQNGTTLQTFLTSTYGNVTTWYDQSGNGRNASQASATNAPVIIQTSNLNMKWALTTTYANPNGSTFLNVSGGTFLNATDFTIMSTSRRTITSNSKVNNALYAYGANSSWRSYTSNVTYPDNSRFVCEFPYQGNRATWNQRANPQNAEAFATIPYYIAGSEPVTYLSLVSKGSINQTTLYCNNAVASTTAAYAQCNANVLMTSAFTIGGASAYGSFGGEIGEFIIFPSALTAAQVSQNYNSEVKNSSGGVVSLTGTPLFSQLSSGATSSAVGAFSLRAVNGTSARAVQVRPVAEFPPGLFTTTSTVISTFSYSQYLTGYAFGGTGTYTSNSSSGSGASTRSWRAFDGVIGGSGSRWVSDAIYVANTPYSGGVSTTAGGTVFPGEWLQLQLPQAIVLSSYSIYPQNTNYPATWNVFASNDGSTWTVIDQRGTAPTLGQYNNYTISGSPAAYSYYRIGCYIVGLGTGFAIVEMKFYGAPTSATTDFYADRLGNLLTAPVTGQSLANWLGGATGYVTTWYDQSGRGNHASQLTAANQPIIQRATKGPGYMCVFNGTTNFLTGMSHTVLNATNFSFNVVERRTGSTSGGTAVNDLTLVSCGNTGAAGKLLYLTYRNNTNSLFGSWDPELYSTISAFTSVSTEPIRYTSATASSTSGRRVYIYNDPLGNPITSTNATQTSLMSMTSGNFQIGYYVFDSSKSYYKGEIYELLVFTQSLYDLDTSGGLITKVYQNQLSAYGT